VVVETKLLELGAALGGFAGLMAMVLMVWFFRQQAAMQRIADARAKADMDARSADRELLKTLLDEIVGARRESNAVIAANSEALTKISQTMREVCGQMDAHDDYVREHLASMGADIARIGNEMTHRPSGQAGRAWPMPEPKT